VSNPPITERLNTALAGRYRIERHLGAGGMATVYLAEDLKHERKVALKVLKPELAAVLGAERFVVEIKTTASLQHPHILPLFDSGTADGFLYYVMPFIEGETLRDKLNRETQLGVDEAVRITREVADALDYAHRRGIIHRDIKPENILLHDGRPMVADFGIALAVSAAAGGRMTETGLSLGTPHYMSPEQATADKEITGRSDIYSLASVLYEMLTGNPPHVGSSAQQIIMKIIADTPRPVTELRKSVPPNVAAAVAKAIEKLPADRFGNAREFADALANPTYTLVTIASPASVPADAKWRARFAVLAAAATLMLLSLGAWRIAARRPDPTVNRFDLWLGDITRSGNSDVAISPDGSMLAVTGFRNGEQAMFLRRLNGDPDFVKVPGSELADGTPSFSPDNQWVAFRRQSDFKLVKVSVNGGGATAIAQLSRTVFPFVHWGTDDLLAYHGGSPVGPILVSASVGQPDTLGLLGTARTTFLLPDGSGLLFNRGPTLWIRDLRTDSSTMLLPFAFHPTYVSTGHLLYVDESGGLFAVVFDLRSHRVSGTPTRVLERVAATPLIRGYSVSQDGQLVYRDAPSILGSTSTYRNLLLVVTPGGIVDTLRLPEGRRLNPRFSPDGRLLAYEQAKNQAGNQTDLYAFDLITGTNTQLTFDGDNDDPVWSPDGKRIAFTKSTLQSGEDVFVKPVDNSAPEQELLSLGGNQNPTAWPDSATILIQSEAAGQSDLLVMSPQPGDKPRPYLEAPWAESEMQLSPDGKLAAFTSWEGGGMDVWIRDYPIPQGKWRVSSSDLSSGPRWTRDGKYVYFWRGSSAAPDTLYRARIDRRPSVVVHTQERVLVMDTPGSGDWDLHPDGKRIVVAAIPAQAAPASAAGNSTASAPRYVIVQNWFTDLKRLTSKAKQ
jgi:eukaryotic-like serine/threonine-protein kinase